MPKTLLSPPSILHFVPLTLLLLLGLPAGAYEVQESIGLVAIHGASEGDEFVLENRKGAEIERGLADRFGSLIFRYLGEGKRYSVRQTEGESVDVRTLVLEDHPKRAFYKGQTLVEGFNYIETRDGTLLAATVRPPLGKTMADGPFPTVVEYSGYTAADPNSPQPSTLIAQGLGFATVGVNMRGSGCSGGVLDLFDLPTTADGYDLIEVVAAQEWVEHGKVGMVGISFPGISQLFVAGARPPHLAAIAPLSVISDIYRSPGFPGGIFNNGFAQSWLQDRNNDARPAPEGGQGWAVKRVEEGDTVCLANQTLRLQTIDAVAFTRDNPFYDKPIMDPRSPINWVDKIQVPVFLSGGWQDEQTGSGFALMLDRFPKRKNIKFTMLNGVHASPLEPEILWEWIAFLDLYVAKRIPDPGRFAIFIPILAAEVLGNGAPSPPTPVDRYDDITSLRKAKKLFESSPRARLLMDNGAGTETAGLPKAAFELGFRDWPPPETKLTTWYLAEAGALTRDAPSRKAAGVDSYRPDPEARPAQTLPGQGQSDSWKILPDYDWQPLVDGTGVGYATAVLTKDVIIAGSSSLDVWLRSSALDTDLQATLSEIRPDGLETYIQGGWLRASQRRLDRKRSTRSSPLSTHFERHEKPLDTAEFAKVRIGILPVAHTFRAGSRIRVTLEAPGGDRTRWAFDTPATNGAVLNEIGRGGKRASRLVLPVIPKAKAATELPPCPGLRGQPCRSYVAASNGG